ncbi:transcription initiation factor tfiif subunit beta [Gigaspora margarita]|uniref:Transcription initiation factor IIF subunit beta n=1 Tax=Gigaspora margarita TaxID=4874 RepID=A0A8H3XI80_GIGMA|nr:transcription initiation factor tfiif subunit beta [Gigaspora margarita]
MGFKISENYISGSEAKSYDGSKDDAYTKERAHRFIVCVFEKYAYWAFKGLKGYVKQPESYLKVVLNEITILYKKGLYNNCYHLKPEYRQNIFSETVSVDPQGVGNHRDMSEDTNRTSELPSPGTSIPYGP